MLFSKRVRPVALVVLIALMLPPVAFPQSINNSPAKSDEFDTVEFLKSFKMGMSYTEVQKVLPKGTEQDILSYLAGEDVFVLTVDIPGGENWSASFKFDTLDAPLRRPETLVEFTCSAEISSRSESFESMVQKVTAAFGKPAKVDKSESKFQQAGWRVTGDSVLTLEYSIVPTGSASRDVSVDFIIKKTRRQPPASKSIA